MAKYAPTDLRSISDNRKLVLDIATDISEIVGVYHKKISEDEFERRLAMQFVGAVFSLWRAVPLVHTSHEPENIVDSSARYLERVVRHNAITYGDDDAQRPWAFGYYMGNARYRLSEVCSDEVVKRWPVGKAALEAQGLLEAATTSRKPGYDQATKVRE